MRSLASFAVGDGWAWISLALLAVGCQESAPRAPASAATEVVAAPAAAAEEPLPAAVETAPSDEPLPAAVETAASDEPSPAAVETAAPEPPASSPPAASPAAVEPAPVAAADRGRQLYARHCAACHGDMGDGRGIAATFLFPKPRNLQAGNFRLVSTDNNVPTREDLHAILIRGMPGSTMPPWAHLPQEDRDALVDEILRIRSEGERSAYVRTLKEDEELSDEEIASPEVQEEIEQHVADFTTPGSPTETPDLGEPSPEGLARGKQAYQKHGCISCHGAEGRGDGVEAMVDIEQMPTSPRDFTLGIFKGNPDPESLYRRIAFGMPGTPMPGSSAMTPEERVDLVHFIRSLSTEEQRAAAVLNRERLSAARVDQLADLQSDSAWSASEPIRLRTAPLWWRTTPDPELQVQAIHDGKEIAVRLSWRDGSQNDQPLRSEAFKDAVAVQVYGGADEPFLGMGDLQSPVDVWFWDADRDGPPATVEDVNPRMVVDIYPFHESTVASAESDREGARTAAQPDVSLPARASGNQIVPPGDGAGGSSLQVGGPGTVTFRMPQSQIVQAHGAWQDGRWTVVMRRPLAPPSPDDGVALQAGKRASVSFAVWDGDKRDRDGQKLITVWQDLTLAP
ncbi:MAG: c-type cytochrome [Pirellulales bacterium]|nr:c-type cytochrome [Pirellulales bacterium]